MKVTMSMPLKLRIVRKIFKWVFISYFFMPSAGWSIDFLPLVVFDNGEVHLDPAFLAILPELQAATALSYNLCRLRKYQYPTSTCTEFENDHFPQHVSSTPGSDPASLLPFPREYPGRTYRLLSGRSGGLQSAGALSGWSDIPGVVIYNPTNHNIIISLRGTNQIADWLTNILALGISGSTVGLNAVPGSIHRGMAVKAQSYFAQLQQILTTLLEGMDPETRATVRIYLVGHSLGAGLAMITSAQLIAFFQMNPALLGYEEGVEFHNPTQNRIGVYGVSAPRIAIGEMTAHQLAALIGPHNVVRHNNQHDLVPVLLPRFFFRSIGHLALQTYQACPGNPSSRSTLVVHALRDGVRGIGQGISRIGRIIEDGADTAGSFCIIAMEDGVVAAGQRIRRPSFADLQQVAPVLLHLISTPVGLVINFARGAIAPVGRFIRATHFASSGYDHALLDPNLPRLLTDGAAHQLRRGTLSHSANPLTFDEPVFFSITADGTQTFQHATVLGDGACGYSALTHAAAAAGITLTIATRQNFIDAMQAFHHNTFIGAPAGLAHAVELASAAHGSFEGWIAALNGGLWMGQDELNIMALVNGIGITVYIYNQDGQLIPHPHMLGGLNPGAPAQINIVFVQHDENGMIVYHGDPTNLAGLMHFDPLIPIAAPVLATTQPRHGIHAQLMQAAAFSYARLLATLFALSNSLRFTRHSMN